MAKSLGKLSSHQIKNCVGTEWERWESIIKTPEEIKQAAFDWNVPVDDTLPMAERILWYSLREIYRNYRDAKINKSEGERLANDALKQYRMDSALLAMQRLQIQHQAEMWRDIERAGSIYRLDKSIDNADAFVDAVYGLKPTGQ